jgi:DNA-binding CsgD family transcriptional regulator/integrase
MRLELLADPSRPVMREPGKIVYTTPADLVRAYLELHLKDKPSYQRQVYIARPWLLTLTMTPTRTEVRERMHVRRDTPSQANTEFRLLRAAIRWGLYHECWEGDDPTVGVKKFKQRKRKRVTKHDEIRKILDYFAHARTEIEIRDRALFGLDLFTGSRPGEARTAKLTGITPYGTMGCWNKGTTKNGEDYEVPVPAQYMPWLEAWKDIRPSARPSPYLFPGQDFEQPLSPDQIVRRWHDLRLIIGIPGLWNYDLRRSLATHMSNELDYSDAKIDAILGHEKTTSLGHYLHVSFDAMTEPIQHYADWLCGLRDELKGESQEPVPVSIKPAVPIPATPPPSQPVMATPIVIDEEDKKRLHSLSEREYETLARLAQGQSCTDIAAALGITVTAVSTFRLRLLKKLHLSTTPELIRHAMTHAVAVPPLTKASAELDPPRPSARECEVLAWFVDGRSCKDIGARRGMAYKTVQTYRARLMRKLHLTNATDLMRYAITHEAKPTTPVPAQQTPPVIAAPVVSQTIPAPMPIVHSSHRYEREDWPG